MCCPTRDAVPFSEGIRSASGAEAHEKKRSSTSCHELEVLAGAESVPIMTPMPKRNFCWRGSLTVHEYLQTKQEMQSTIVFFLSVQSVISSMQNAREKKVGVDKIRSQAPVKTCRFTLFWEHLLDFLPAFAASIYTNTLLILTRFHCWTFCCQLLQQTYAPTPYNYLS